ncbi:hypothetical protein [Agromyces sp. CCNWLW203]|uniref:hypothetical protein n=1 Tax=Agromyces sp. CCNWLW203 TaxID=3112842 RepID=UPI002F960D7B
MEVGVIAVAPLAEQPGDQRIEHPPAHMLRDPDERNAACLGYLGEQGGLAVVALDRDRRVVGPLRHGREIGQALGRDLRSRGCEQQSVGFISQFIERVMELGSQHAPCRVGVSDQRCGLGAEFGEEFTELDARRIWRNNDIHLANLYRNYKF